MAASSGKTWSRRPASAARRPPRKRRPQSLPQPQGRPTPAGKSWRGARPPASRAACPTTKCSRCYEPGSYEIVPLDTMRRFIAERLTLSKQTIPHFYLAIDCQLDALLAARARLNAHGAARRATRLQALGQ